MKRFVFRLEKVLQLRADAEQECARALADAARAEQERRRDRETEAERLERIGQQLTPATGQPVTAGVLRALVLTAEAAAARLEAAEQSLGEANQALDAQRTRYTQAQVERRSLEKLRERRLDEWTRDASRAEQAHLDEIALRNHGREKTP